jgi:hypothetical protein
VTRLGAAGAGAALVWIAGLLVITPAPLPARPVAPARLLVQGSEFRLALSRASVASGTAVVQLANVGQDAHDLHLVRLSRRGHPTGRVRRIRETAPGATAQWRGRLSRGRWKLYCSLPGHERLGMRATLRVR